MSGTTPAPVTVAPSTPCPGLEESGWLLFKEHCYKVYSQTSIQPMTWKNSRAECQASGAELMSILDEEENSFVVSMVQNSHKTIEILLICKFVIQSQLSSYLENDVV